VRYYFIQHFRSIENMEDKELKKRLKKIPDVDKNGDPIYKIDIADSSKKSDSGKQQKKANDR